MPQPFGRRRSTDTSAERKPAIPNLPRSMDIKPVFQPDQLSAVTHAVGMAEDLVSNHYKMTTSEWLRPKYDVRTLAELEPGEVVDGPFAQIIRYHGQPEAGVAEFGHIRFLQNLPPRPCHSRRAANKPRAAPAAVCALHHHPRTDSHRAFQPVSPGIRRLA
ncbi:MAG: hypothetical protein MZV70_62960 [Desulfobacterales bacterium]|nr:hypothetical protein [Desulfobacterales bacterium]